MLDGACRLDKLVERAHELKFSALPITDHGVLYGAIDFYQAARNKGIKPILGSVLRTPVHSVVALIQNRAGYRSLCCILSRLNLNDDANLGELLLQFNQGLHLLVDTPELLELLHRVFVS